MTGAAVFTQRPTEVAFPSNHPQYAGAAPRVPVEPNPLAPYDVIFITGMAVFPHIFFPAQPLLPPHSKIIHLDPDSWEVGRNLPIEHGLVGDIGLTLASLTKRIAHSADDEYQKAVEKRRQEVSATQAAASESLKRRIEAARGKRPMAPISAFATLADELPAGAVVFDDAVSNSPALNEAIGHMEAGTRFLTTHRAGAVGWGLGAAIGGQLARPDRRVVAVVGDGAAMYSIQALWTAAHHDLPIVFIIANNRSYELLKMNIRAYLQGSDRQSAYLAMDLDKPCIDFAGLAHSQGVHGTRASTEEDLQAALREAFAHNGPSLIDVQLST
jgi:benzoylformate decarboxylase